MVFCYLFFLEDLTKVDIPMALLTNNVEGKDWKLPLPVNRITQILRFFLKNISNNTLLITHISLSYHLWQSLDCKLEGENASEISIGLFVWVMDLTEFIVHFVRLFDPFVYTIGIKCSKQVWWASKETIQKYVRYMNYVRIHKFHHSLSLGWKHSPQVV